jgi:hypothetical protein
MHFVQRMREWSQIDNIRDLRVGKAPYQNGEISTEIEASSSVAPF